MVAFRRVLRRPILGGFEKIHFQGLDYGEVEPNFVEEFEDELNYEWEIIKANGSSNFITFNGNLIRPMLTIGWNNLRNVYSFNDNKRMFFNYLGRSRFSITIRNNIKNENRIPSFHSRSTKPRRTVYFNITLTHLQMAIPSILVFSCYIYKSNFL
ncbi:DNA helicase [Trifolium repens]|nr:DNA helicase [Trifolium repens]